MAPTPQVATVSVEAVKESRALIERWRAIEAQDIPALNKQLKAAGIPEVEMKEPK